MSAFDVRVINHRPMINEDGLVLYAFLFCDTPNIGAGLVGRAVNFQTIYQKMAGLMHSFNPICLWVHTAFQFHIG